jgi:putative ATP-dependent endonuclease of the OLD family
MSTKFQDSGIKIIEVRIRNFRSLKQVNVSLDWLTVLIGENNSGKTSFLDALSAAIGIGKRDISRDEIFLAPSENKVPKEREITIDVLIRPTDDKGETIDSFLEGSYWIELWGNGISQDDNDNEYVGIRTQMKWDSARSEYITERNFLVNWQDNPNKWDLARINETAGFVSTAKIEPLALYLLDAKRDVKDELQKRGSFWHKLVSDLNLADTEIEDIEKALTTLNHAIISSSDVLVHVQNHLDDLHKTIGGDKGNVSITSIPRHIRDLSKGMDVNFATKGAQTFPLARHGMGTRCLAAVLMFRAYTTWRQKNAKYDQVHSMLALEEPEAHLHPQAHRALFNQIEEMSGQRIISTHSPYIAGQAEIAQLRHFRKDGANAVVTQIDTTSLGPEDIRKINRMVLNTRGDILYARALVLFEGETEEQALPIFAESYWQRQPTALGINLVGVGGSGNYLPFLRLASSFEIPWYIFSDGEPDARKHVKESLEQIGVKDPDPIRHANVFVLPADHNFESYLVAEKYEDTILAMLDSYHMTKNYLDTDYIQKMHGQKKTKTIIRDYKSSEGRKRALVDVLTEKKTQYAVPLAQSIISLGDKTRRYPDKLQELFKRISIDMDL